jgi:serine protein kinase
MNAKAEEILSLISDDQDMEKFRALHWTGSFKDYLDLVHERPLIVRNSFQRLYDMIMSYGYDEYTDGPERRVLLLHGPVGSSKSTIVRLLKKGLEAYSRSAEGALYTFDWVIEGEKVRSMMNEEPLLLVPPGPRQRLLDHLNEKTRCSYKFKLDFDLSPISRFYYDKLMREYNGDWQKVLETTCRSVVC